MSDAPPEELALLEAIYATPEDDAPRLVYADALLERGDPRGELIVRQCRGDKAEELVARHGDAWLGELRPVLAEFTFERGFLGFAKLAQPRADAQIAPLVGHPTWSTVRELRGSAAIALHPSMRALRVLEVDREPAYWPELLTGAPRPIVELHYAPGATETWDHDGDITATPHSGGVWTRGFSREEFAALAQCTALPALRKLVLSLVPPTWLATVLAGPILDRVRVIEVWNTPIHTTIAGGLAVIDIAPRASPHITDVALELLRALPAHLGIELNTGPNFPGTPIIERIAGPRLRRGRR